MNAPLVSVIVPTRNSARTLEACLKSIKSQIHPSIELIVVDNHSTDKTPEIAGRYADVFLTLGPERSVQRNAGAKAAKGEHLTFIDSDMVLDPHVITQCVAAEAEAVVIPEESFGEGFWASCKRLERSFYVGVKWMEAARFFRTSSFKETGGYHDEMVSGEDWDLSQRVGKIGKIARIDAVIRHDEGRLRFVDTLRKKWYYARKFRYYRAEHAATAALAKQTGVLARYGLFFSKPDRLFTDPLIGLGMLFMKTCEFAVGGLALLTSTRR